MDAPEVWIPMFTQHWTDEQILNPTFCMTFDHCKLCDVHVDPGQQKEHISRHKRELAAWRRKQRSKVESARLDGLRKARKARAA